VQFLWISRCFYVYTSYIRIVVVRLLRLSGPGRPRSWRQRSQYYVVHTGWLDLNGDGWWRRRRCVNGKMTVYGNKTTGTKNKRPTVCFRARCCMCEKKKFRKSNLQASLFPKYSFYFEIIVKRTTFFVRQTTNSTRNNFRAMRLTIRHIFIYNYISREFERCITGWPVQTGRQQQDHR